MGEAVLGHDLVALGALATKKEYTNYKRQLTNIDKQTTNNRGYLATTRSSENPDDGQARGSQGGAIHRLELFLLLAPSGALIAIPTYY